MSSIWPLKRGISTAKGKRVFVGISGGVDSAVSAALLQKGGYDVTGVFIKIQIAGYPCPAAQDRVEAMRVAAHLKIPFLEVDLSREYEREVFAPSIEEFKVGHTPNPDTLCNEKIKFGVFFEFARSRGAEFVATGHYARVVDGELYAGVDKSKDQSYFLWGVPQTALERTIFPIGHLHKTQVRELAQELHLPNAARKDSQGLCFLGDIALEDMLMREVPQTPGDVVTESGDVVGTHKGAALYTLGQRHGFALAVHTSDEEPRFVVAKDIARNTITVSTSAFPLDAHKTHITLASTNWLGSVEPGEYQARYRYHGKLIPALLEEGLAQATLLEPHYVPLGQSLVFYKGEQCLGGGVVASATLKA